MSKENNKKSSKAPLIIISAVLAIAVIITGLNLLTVQKLLEKGNTYSKVQYENQLVPQRDENGNWYFTTDGDFKVMHITFLL